ncbi:copper resistance protein CopC [Neobacillus drentensis]|uniref:copper resistance CopC family protein n=1 Tax=Neobacillus drentensis TaxID=220684 RepID=UPI003000F5CF
MIPSLVSAHSGLTSSNPTEGQVLTEDLKEILLTFNTNIESLSTMKLLKDSKEIPITSIQVQEQQMKGVISESLENGSYIIAWNIVGKDGHVIEGEIPFTVQKEQTEEEIENPSSSEEDQGTIQEESQTTNEEEKTEEPKQNNETSEETKGQTETTPSNTSMEIIIIGLVIILGIGLLLVSRKKR